VRLGEGDIWSEVRGDVIKDGPVLRIRRIEATYHLRVPEEKRDTVARVHSFHADHCPVARTLEGCVEIETRFQLVE
jgi:uncharacterized OsmC-like protein